jgi:hypothetical protein
MSEQIECLDLPLEFEELNLGVEVAAAAHRGETEPDLSAGYVFLHLALL